jgi:hypothetical protein
MRFPVTLFRLSKSAGNTRQAPEHVPGFDIDASTHDRARQLVRERLLQRGFRVRSVNFSSHGGIIAYVEEKADK